MSSDGQIEKLFQDAVDHYRPEDWPAFLDRASLDTGSRQSLERMLLHHLRQPPQDRLPAVACVFERPGQKIGRYELLEEIGEGSFGIVFRAQQIEPIRRSVAVKILKPGMDSREILARFRREQRVLARLNHPNIAAVYDAGVTPTGRPYFVMELAVGEPLTDYCDMRCLTIRDRLELFRTVCHAVQHAHGKGVVHRDLKPQNILVGGDGSAGQAKVVDFGLAQVTEGGSTDSDVFTIVDRPVGTPKYMSPEQAVGEYDRVDSRSDVYSLGVVLYELLTGTTPSEDDSSGATTTSILAPTTSNGRVLYPSACLTRLGAESARESAAARSATVPQLIRQFKGELDWIADKALDPDRDRRYETARGLRDDVGRYLLGDSVEARPPSKTYLLRKRLGHNRLWWLTRMIIVTAMLLSVITAWQLYRLGSFHYRLYRMKTLNAQVTRSWKPSQDPGRVQLVEKLLAVQREVLGERDPATLWTQVELSRAYGWSRNFAKAIPLAEESYARLLEIQGAETSYIGGCRINLFTLYLEQVWDAVGPGPDGERHADFERIPELAQLQRSFRKRSSSTFIG